MMAACADDPADPLATARMEVVSGQQQAGDAGSPLQPVRVRVVTSQGTPLPNVKIEWLVLEGGGTAAPVASSTDANGVATTNWILGETGGTQALLAKAPTASARIEATATIHFTQVTAGFRHTCALTASGRAYCWGSNDRGQLGLGIVSTVATPALVADSLRFTQISAGWFHTCAVTATHAVYCWGDNSVGQLGSAGGTTATPRLVALNDIESVSAGYQHTCAVAVDGAAYCWGVDDVGALGAGGTAPPCFSGLVQRCTATPLRVATTALLAEVVAGEFHGCARARDGAVYCWGWNSDGQVGNLGNAANAIIAVPMRVSSNRLYGSLGVGARHTCALTTGELAECWGRNAAGEIGVTAGTALSAPNPLTSAMQFRAIDAGETHSCALAADQRVYCWGSLLGNGTTQSSSTPVAVTLSGAATSITAGGDHACAIVDGEVWCWGSSAYGQLGVPGIPRSNAPVKVEVGQ